MNGHKCYFMIEKNHTFTTDATFDSILFSGFFVQRKSFYSAITRTLDKVFEQVDHDGDTGKPMYAEEWFYGYWRLE